MIENNNVRTDELQTDELQTENPSPKNEKSNTLKYIMIGLALIIVLVVGVIFLLSSLTTQRVEVISELPKQKVIGLSLSSLRIERWQSDRQMMEEEANKLGILLNVTDANDDSNVQISQAESLILQGVDVLIVVANDAATAGEIVEIAHEHDVKVIAYDRLILDSDLDYYVSFDSVEVGRKQAEAIVKEAGDLQNYAYIGGSPTDHNAELLKEGSMKVLQPMLDLGEINLVLDVFIDDWKQELAYQEMINFLDAGGKVDAVIAANDGNASGVAQALSEYGLDGKVFVSGQDSELTACKRIVAGTQTMTVYKPLDTLATYAVDLASRIINNEEIVLEKTTNNGKVDVPTYFVDSITVTKDNMEEVIVDNGFHTYDEIFK